MRALHSGAIFSVLLAATFVGAGESPFTFPAEPVPPAPPAPAPGAVATLKGGELYVVSSKVDAVVRAHPAGVVRFQKFAGPIVVYGKFSNTEKPELRKYDGPHVFVLEAAGKGRVDVDFIPLGLKAEADIVSVSLDVDAGQGPQPPPAPKPEPKPEPQPEPGPDVRTEKVWVIVVEKADTPRTTEVAKALNDPLWLSLRPKHDWRHYLSNSDVAVKNNYARLADEVGYPACLILDAKDGKVIKKFKFATAGEIDAAVKSVAK